MAMDNHAKRVSSDSLVTVLILLSAIVVDCEALRHRKQSLGEKIFFARWEDGVGCKLRNSSRAGHLTFRSN